MSKIFHRTELDAYEDWINSIEWTFFCTFTTPYTLTLNSARRLMERTQERYKSYAGECSLFWVAEPFEAKDGYHTHGLLKLPKSMVNKDGSVNRHHFQNLLDTYQAMTGAKVIANDKGKLSYDQWNRIDLKKFDKRKNAGKYALKYIKKSQKGKGDYDILF